MPQNICIIGPGAVGLSLAAYLGRSLTESGAKIWIAGKEGSGPDLERTIVTDSQGNRIALAGLGISAIDQTEYRNLPGDASFWVCTKAYDLDLALKEIEPYVTLKTPILLLQNGLGILLQAAETIRRKAPLLRLIPYYGARRIGLSEIRTEGDIKFSLTALKEYSVLIGDFKKLLENAGIAVQADQDVATAEWRKMPLNMVVNSICTIVGGRNGIILEQEPLTRLAKEVLREVRAVARAEGFDLSSVTDEVVFLLIERFKENINSTLADLQAKKPTEIDYIFGRFLKVAESFEVRVPYTETLNALLQAAISHKDPIAQSEV